MAEKDPGHLLCIVFPVTKDTGSNLRLRHLCPSPFSSATPGPVYIPHWGEAGPENRELNGWEFPSFRLNTKHLAGLCVCVLYVFLCVNIVLLCVSVYILVCIVCFCVFCFFLCVLCVYVCVSLCFCVLCVYVSMCFCVCIVCFCVCAWLQRAQLLLFE